MNNRARIERALPLRPGDFVKSLLPLLILILIAAPALGEEMAQRLARLEASQAEIYHTLSEKKSAGSLARITETLTLSGLLEVEAFFESIETTDGSSTSGSDLALATAQLGFGFTPLEPVGFDVSLLYEGEGSDLEVDEAFATLTAGPVSARIGQLYLPFGVYYSHFVSDPLLLEIGETRETALVTELGLPRARLALFAFNGDAERRADNEDHLRDWGASLSIAPLEGVEFGASYLSDLADSSAELLRDETTNPDNLYTDRVAGWSTFANLEFGPFGVSAEALGAVERFNPVDLDADLNGRGDKPFAYNLEAYHHFGERVEVALRYEESRELASQPKRQYGVCSSWGAQHNLSISLEYLYGEFEAEFAADDERTRHLTTLQLAVIL